MRSILTVFCILAMLPSAYAAADKTSHPLVTPYEGSTLRRKDVKAFDEYKLITGSDRKAFSGPTLQGKITKILYDNPKDRSMLEMFTNYEAALKGSGAEILFVCNQEHDHECMEKYAGPAFQEHSDIHAMSNLKGRFMSAKLEQDEQTAYIVIAVGQTFTNVHVIEIKTMDTGKVSVNPAILGEGIDKDGYVIVEGIYFDTDKTTLKSESKPALDAIAGLLKERATLKVFVVGHTDMQGSVAHNMSLSGGRAKAVANALTAEYGISADRMEGHGVGPLAPQATNQSEGGRARNRRVVLVGR